MLSLPPSVARIRWRPRCPQVEAGEESSEGTHEPVSADLRELRSWLTVNSRLQAAHSVDRPVPSRP